MSFYNTRKYHMMVNALVGGLIGLDALYGNTLKSAFDVNNTFIVAFWALGLYFLLSMIGMQIMIKPFYDAGGRLWTKGGREQFAYAGGFAVQVYGIILIVAMVILIYPYVQQRYGWVILNSGVTITILSIVLTVIVCWMSAKIIFGKLSRY